MIYRTILEIYNLATYPEEHETSKDTHLLKKNLCLSVAVSQPIKRVGVEESTGPPREINHFSKTEKSQKSQLFDALQLSSWRVEKKWEEFISTVKIK